MPRLDQKYYFHLTQLSCTPEIWQKNQRKLADCSLIILDLIPIKPFVRSADLPKLKILRCRLKSRSDIFQSEHRLVFSLRLCRACV